jgi:muramidase (phage lysozyme)
MARITVTAAGGRNRVAFLDMIAVSEIGSDLLAKSDDGYNVLVGSTPSRLLLFSNYAAHPNVLNRQIPVPSTAAGRYQILTRWWRIYQAQMKLGLRSGFAGPVRIAAAARARRIAVDRRRPPPRGGGEGVERMGQPAGAGYGQHENKIEHLLAAYRAAGGEVVAMTWIDPRIWLLVVAGVVAGSACGYLRAP